MPAINLDIHVDNLSAVLEVFDQIQVWRSVTGQDGVYTELTAAERMKAQANGSSAGPWALAGQLLSAVINAGQTQTFAFRGSGMFDLATVLGQINGSSLGFTAQEVSSGSGRLSLLSKTEGTGASIQVLATPAATILGLPTTKTNGLAARLRMATPTEDYIFTDLDGDKAYFYKTRFYNSVSGTLGPFSLPMQGAPGSAVSPTNLSTATVQLMDGSGAPLAGRRILFVLVVPTTVGSIYSLPGGHEVRATTDDAGAASQSLIIGGTYRVYFEGSSYNREIVVPNTPTFDLLAAMSTAPDPFSIQQIPPMPIRTTI